jgi:acid phosphatase
MKRRSLLAGLLGLPFASRLLAKDCEVHGDRFAQTQYAPIPEGMQRVFVLGDWGTGGSLQKKVAGAMNKIAGAGGKPLAIVSTGDNIYPDGVRSADDPQWRSKFEKVYDLEHLQSLPWISVLGNHDHRGSVLAQSEYGKRNTQWMMPSAYFVRPCPQAEQLVTFVCLDTQAILKKLDGWRDQITWLKQSLAAITTPWKIVVGHHPIRSYGHYQDQDWMIEHVAPHLNDGGVQLYLCGHDHDLQILRKPEDAFTCVVSGAGSGCRSTTWGRHTVAAATGGGFAVLHVDEQRMYAELIDASGNGRGLMHVGLEGGK